MPWSLWSKRLQDIVVLICSSPVRYNSECQDIVCIPFVVSSSIDDALDFDGDRGCRRLPRFRFEGVDTTGNCSDNSSISQRT